MKKWADALWTYASEHYVFHREWPAIDPKHPMSGWRTAWRSLREAAAKDDAEKGSEPMSRLAKFRYYDLRHQCITEMLESGVPEGVIREVAGHVDPATTRHSSHPRITARRAAVQALMTGKLRQFEAGYGTNHGTKAFPGNVIVR